ncbi:MAG: hypothetical protein ACKOEC_13820 [Acidimicrobiia bacterium]
MSFLEHVAATRLDQWQAILANLLKQQHQQGRYIFTATLSELGQLSCAALSCPEFAATSAYFVPPLADQVCFVACNGFDRSPGLCRAEALWRRNPPHVICPSV